MAYIQKKGQPSRKFAAFFIVSATLLPAVMFYTTLEKMWNAGNAPATLGVQTHIERSVPTPTPEVEVLE